MRSIKYFSKSFLKKLLTFPYTYISDGKSKYAMVCIVGKCGVIHLPSWSHPRYSVGLLNIILWQ